MALEMRHVRKHADCLSCPDAVPVQQAAPADVVNVFADLDDDWSAPPLRKPDAAMGLSFRHRRALLPVG